MCIYVYLNSLLYIYIYTYTYMYIYPHLYTYYHILYINKVDMGIGIIAGIYTFVCKYI
jgi:hypothetical protein